MNEYSGLRKTLDRRDREIHDLRSITAALATWLYAIEIGRATAEEALANLKLLSEEQAKRDYR